MLPSNWWINHESLFLAGVIPRRLLFNQCKPLCYHRHWWWRHLLLIQLSSVLDISFGRRVTWEPKSLLFTFKIRRAIINSFFRLILAAPIVPVINAGLTEALFEQVPRALTPMLLASLPHLNSLRTRFACKEKSIMLIPGEPSHLESFCLQTFAAPALASALLATISSPSSFKWTMWLLLALLGASPLLSLSLLRLGLISWLQSINHRLGLKPWQKSARKSTLVTWDC